MAGEAVTGTGAVGEREPRNRARGGGQNGRGEEGEAGRRGEEEEKCKEKGNGARGRRDRHTKRGERVGWARR